MLLSALLALVASATIQIHHQQVPVVQDRDVPVAAVTVPEGESPDFKVSLKGLPRKALRSWSVRDGYLYVNLDAAQVKDIRKPFSLRIRAKGFDIQESGALWHRLARKVRTSGDDGVNAYRIPGLVTTKKGTLVGVYDIRHENARDLTWRVHEYAKINTTESQVVEVAPGELMLNMRDNRGTGRAVYTTTDFGRTWTPHVSDGKLVEPVCMASLLKVRADENALGRDILLFSNPADAKQRKNITIQMSLDGGKTWTRKCLLDEGGSWGYSCLTMIDKDTVGILYESSQVHMTFQAIPLKDIR